MNTTPFKIVKHGITYTPVEATTYTGSLITLYVDEEKFNKGEPTNAFTLEALRDEVGKLTVVNDEVVIVK